MEFHSDGRIFLSLVTGVLFYCYFLLETLLALSAR